MKTKVLQILNWLFFMGMVVANYLANALPFNNKTTKQVSDQYPNLFVPAPITFAIWGIIYLLILYFCIKQSKNLFSKVNDRATEEVLNKIGISFIVTCVLNIFWMLSWHFDYVAVSVIIMLTLLVQLISLNLKIDTLTPYMNFSTKFSLKAPFGIYLGWICVATIANVTAALVHIHWNGWGQGEVFWTCAMILIGAIIIAWATNKLRNGFIATAGIWAFSGIIINRIAISPYQRFIVWVAVGAIIVLFLGLLLEISRFIFRKPLIPSDLTSPDSPIVLES